ncbi:MAG: c-type cytochrome [Verrucomicrobia bacterium]|nr:c-type cytochrome [Verrucomicrobiota bacterium]
MHCFRSVSTTVFCALICWSSSLLAQAPTAGGQPHPSALSEPPREVFGSERARKTLFNFPSRGARTDLSIPPKSPAQTIASFKLMPGLEAEVVLCEPVVRQPVFLNFDERGRMWVVQFLQYPYPAGLKILDFDDQFHAVYDRVPPPPPRHDRGADRITIHEDRDGNGTFETHKTFLEGLNMVTSVERGRGGVWVLNPPYLVFWPDQNNDDAPDGEPVVHLAGFGLEDTHSTANSLRWGPDGWLYGAQGSGVSSTIKRPGLDDGQPGFYFKGQTIWRYHPETHAFELFSEGGGNTFCVEFDAGGRLYSGINGNNHRGFHFVQGGYYSKNFGEHGFFTNPNTFGYLSPMPHDRPVPRFSHTFVVYEAGALGAPFEGKIIAPVPLQNHVVLSEFVPNGSTYSTSDLGLFLESSDRWFRPVDIKVGPDSAVYIADWYDTRLSHMDPRDTWDRQHGRIYRIKAEAASPVKPFDLSKLTGDQLVDVLSHTNKWFRQQAVHLLADRRDHGVTDRLRRLAMQPDNPRALDALWGLHAVNGFTSEVAVELMRHTQPELRAWAVRLIGDNWGAARRGTHEVEKTGPRAFPSASLAEALRALARKEPNAQVRSQIASTAKRLPCEVALPLLAELLRRGEDHSDPHIPLLLWWALEDKLISHRDEAVQLFEQPDLWSQPLVRHHILDRLARRHATLPTPENQRSLAALLRLAPDAECKRRLLDGVNEAFKGRAVEGLIESFERTLDQANAGGKRDPSQVALALRRGSAPAVTEAMGLIAQENFGNELDRILLIQALGESHRTEATSVLLELLGSSKSSAVRGAALQALGHFDSLGLVDDVLFRWANLDAPLRRCALAVLCSRKTWARRLLNAVGGAGVISKQDVPDEMVSRLRFLGDSEVSALCDRFFGKPTQASSEEKQKRIDVVAAALKEPSPVDAAAGKSLFGARCAACHELFGEGGKLGPDLTGYERTNLETLLLNIVDPSVAIREGYALFQITTKDGRDLAGFITERDGFRLTLRDLSGNTTVVPLDQIQQERSISTSLMPGGLIDDLTPQQLRDLFAFLASPVPSKP